MQLLRDEVAVIQLIRDEVQVSTTWSNLVDKIAGLIMNDTPDRFLEWIPICRSMFIRGVTGHVIPKLDYLRYHLDWPMWEPAIREDSVGQPATFEVYDNTSGTRIMHAYHMSKLYDACGVRLWEAPYVFEFGGGYGGNMRVVHKLGFQGKYLLYDMPVISALQRYYLRNLGVPDSMYETSSTVERTEEILRTFKKEEGVFLATMSFSESPVASRQPFVDMLDGFGTIFISYAEMFYGIDNIAYFDELMARLDSYEWMTWPVDDREGKQYLLGRLHGQSW